MKSKPPDNFAVFILTHGRPDNVITQKTLQKGGYTGKLFFIVDDEDESVEQYKANFGHENVIVFNKKAIADSCDEGNNFDERRCIMMARNACFGIASSLGITHFLQLDDDYSSFRYRYIDQYITKGTCVNLDRLFASMLAFSLSINAKSIAFAQGGDFISGAGCRLLNNYKNRARKCMNTFFCSTDTPFEFVGSMNEDVNTYSLGGSRGDVFLTIPFVGVEQRATQTQSGGITDMHLRYGTYCKSFTSVMMHPSSVFVNMMGFKQTRLHHVIKWVNTVPQIIKEHHRKS